MIKVSVVVPVYNVEEYLRECLDSLVNQTLSDIEIILVNDGSTDNSPAICEEYAKKYEKIKYISQKNQGLSGARNTGIRVAKGEYIGFVDSDDYVKRDMYEFLYNNAKEYKVAISACGFIFDGKSHMRSGVRKLYDKSEALNYYLLPCYYEIMVWNKIYKRELFNTVQFPLGEKNEDLPTVWRLIANANGLYFDSTVKYFYRNRIGSLAKEKFTPEVYRMVRDTDEIVKYMEENDLHPDLVYLGQASWCMLVLERAMAGGGGINMELVSKIRGIVRKKLPEILSTDAMRLRSKVRLCSILLPIPLFKRISPMRMRIKVLKRKLKGMR